MRRIVCYQPEGVLTSTLVNDMLRLVGYRLRSPGGVNAWTEVELLIAYDFAARLHLRASDNTNVRRRPAPTCIVELIPLGELGPAASSTHGEDHDEEDDEGLPADLFPADPIWEEHARYPAGRGED